MLKEFHQITWDAQTADDCRHLIRLAVREDLDHGYDWTSVALVPSSGRGQVGIVAREPGVIAGLAAIPLILEEMDADIRWNPRTTDGTVVPADEVLGILTGSARDLLATERPILNLLGHLSGIASLTHQFVGRVEGTSARVYDTRKTCPGYRRLEKYAVHCGGGRNHRTGLFDAILIKDNHLAFGASSNVKAFTPAAAVEAARNFLQTTPPPQLAQMIIEIEVDSLEQFEQVLLVGPDIVLLDNMSLDELRMAVKRRSQVAPTIQLEASGGVNLQTIQQIASTGVDRISVGALTHSARCLDVAIDWIDS